MLAADPLLLKACLLDPGNVSTRHQLTDWLEENGRADGIILAVLRGNGRWGIGSVHPMWCFLVSEAMSGAVPTYGHNPEYYLPFDMVDHGIECGLCGSKSDLRQLGEGKLDGKLWRCHNLAICNTAQRRQGQQPSSRDRRRDWIYAEPTEWAWTLPQVSVAHWLQPPLSVADWESPGWRSVTSDALGPIWTTVARPNTSEEE